MADFSLYARMREQGTLAEKASDVPDARFALPSTINWMRALALLVVQLGLNYSEARAFYANVQRRTISDRELNSICEQLLFSLHQIAALQSMEDARNKADVARVGIVTWYYGVYGAASAMIAAADGSFPDNHTATAQQWSRQFPANGLGIAPFGDYLSNLLEETTKNELGPIRSRGTHSLVSTPTSIEQAWGCCAEYLSGTADWERWNIRERAVDSKEFKNLGVDSFRTGAARKLRDGRYEKRGIAFLHQASRYRGKANYRDAIYLGYGKSVPKLVDGLIHDLRIVLSAFSAMAAAYASVRMGREQWASFLEDLETKRSISVSPKSIWS
jgi:hypothetical protein